MFRDNHITSLMIIVIKADMIHHNLATVKERLTLVTARTQQRLQKCTQTKVQMLMPLKMKMVQLSKFLRRVQIPVTDGAKTLMKSITTSGQPVSRAKATDRITDKISLC